MINIKNLNFNYNKAKPLFRDMNMQLEEGHIYGLLGKNGAGKSTLLKNIAGLVYPWSGSLDVLGHDPRKREPALLRQISFIPEEFHLPSVKSSSYVSVNAPFYPNFDHQYLHELLIEFEIPTQQKLSEMSYGQKKKYIIAFGLATKARLIIMDEPTNGLDIPSKAQFRKIMASAMTDDCCIIISTHQVRDLDNLIDTVILLDEQKVALSASIEEITKRLIFKKVKEVDSAALYMEEGIGGFNTIAINNDQGESRLDMELFFNAVLAKKDGITSLLNTTNHE